MVGRLNSFWEDLFSGAFAVCFRELYQSSSNSWEIELSPTPRHGTFQLQPIIERNMSHTDSSGGNKKCTPSYGCFQKEWFLPPQIIHFNRVFHYKPSILGYPYFWKQPYPNESHKKQKTSPTRQQDCCLLCVSYAEGGWEESSPSWGLRSL